jgi:hypothetical protein
MRGVIAKAMSARETAEENKGGGGDEPRKASD